eukprot:Opistho-2@60122
MMVEAEEDEAAGFGDALRPTTPVPQAATDYVQLETQKTDGRTRTASTLRTVGASLPTPRQSESDAQSSIDEGGIIVDDVGATESLNVEDFSRWVTCLCVVAFDIELGQAMEYMYPPGRLSDAETAAVCYLSFPDSNAGMVGDSVFSFRVKAGAENHPHSRGSLASSSSPVLSGNEAGALAVPASSVSMGSNGGSPSTRPSTASVSSATSAPSLQSTLSKAMMNTPSPVQGDVYYGYVFFRQVRDANLKRGYFQKSLVLLSPHPFVGLFSRIVRLIAPEFFDNGRPLLEAACRNISRWPSPAPGNTFELPILGHVLQVRVPAPHEKADFWNDSIDERDGVVGGQRRIHASLLEIDAFSCFRGVIGELYALWELVLTAEPLIVMAATPTCCSDTVLALISLISPLSYSCDYRPYFTIHDSDFKEFTSKTKPAPHAILGVTNPFFTKAFQHWPHMLKVGAAPKSSSPLSPNGDAGLVRRRRSDEAHTRLGLPSLSRPRQGLSQAPDLHAQSQSRRLRRLGGRGVPAKRQPSTALCRAHKRFHGSTREVLFVAHAAAKEGNGMAQPAASKVVQQG